MSMLELKITDAECLRSLDDIRTKCEQREPLMREISGIMHHAVEENFAHDGRPDKWKPLAASTIRARRAKGAWPGRILQVRGKLAASIQERSDNDSAAVGTNDKRARLLFLGGTVNHAARERILHFTQVRRGQMTHSRPGTGDKFAKPGKARYGMKVQGKAYSVKIEGRNPLHLEPTDLRRIMTAAQNYIFKRQ